jgi:hypothetical protein
MNLVSLDLSTKPGWAFFEGEKLVGYGTIFPDMKPSDFGTYPVSYLGYTQYVGDKVVEKVKEFQQGKSEKVQVVIEETTASRNNYSQRQIEWIHQAVCIGLLQQLDITPSYVRVGVWRTMVNARQNVVEKKLNAEISKIKKKTGSNIVKINGKRVGKITRKHVAIRVFQEVFGARLPVKMNDAAEAALVGLAFIKGCPICDGTTDGGKLIRSAE